jgi:hypothetical protein
MRGTAMNSDFQSRYSISLSCEREWRAGVANLSGIFGVVIVALGPIRVTFTHPV